jgi:hypothetical protein
MRRVVWAYVIPGVDYVHDEPLLLGILLALVVFRRGACAPRQKTTTWTYGVPR